MMGEKGANDHRRRHGVRRRIDVAVAWLMVERLVKTEAAVQTLFGQLFEVVRRRGRIDERGEGGGIGGHDEIARKPSLQSETGYAERAILIIARSIGERVGAFRDSPRNAALSRIVTLPDDTGATALIEKRAGKCAHQQQRHQVLEHRAAPRHQRRLSVDVGYWTTEMKPMVLRYLTLRDGHKARQARFGCQQVVERPIRLTRSIGIRQAITNRKNALAP